MQQHQHTHTELAQWSMRLMGGFYLLGVALFVLLPTLNHTPPPNVESDLDQTNWFINQPELARDLEEIQASGVLRVLTRNNSTSYLVLRGEEYGFEYELARRFAKSLDVKLEVVLADSQYSMVSMLNKGEGDLVAAPLVPSLELREAAAFSNPYNELYHVLVVPKEYVHLYTKPEDLKSRMVAVRRWSNHQEILVDLRRRDIPVGMVLLQPDISTEEILDMVADGTYGAAIASSHVAQAALTHRPELAIAFPLTANQNVNWAARTNSPKLMVALNRFLAGQYRRTDDGKVVQSKLYRVLFHKYFVDEKQIRRRAEDPFFLAKTGKLSPYDDLIRDVSARNKLDWHLIASLCMQESRFDPEAESWAGAIGLMQVLPKTAQRSAEALKDPVLNVEIGTAYLRGLYDAFSYLPHEQRLAFALASYNAGKGHVDDARMLAIMEGMNPNQWHGSVEQCILLLLKPEYHRRVRYGYVRGTETVGYVREVLRRYDLFREVSERDSSARSRAGERETASRSR